MENKKKISGILIKKSQERLVKALDKLESTIVAKLESAKSSQDSELVGMKEELSKVQLQNRELNYALDKIAATSESGQSNIEGAIVELDETIENIERILKIQNADN